MNVVIKAALGLLQPQQKPFIFSIKWRLFEADNHPDEILNALVLTEVCGTVHKRLHYVNCWLITQLSFFEKPWAPLLKRFRRDLFITVNTLLFWLSVKVIAYHYDGWAVCKIVVKRNTHRDVQKTGWPLLAAAYVRDHFLYISTVLTILLNAFEQLKLLEELKPIENSFFRQRSIELHLFNVLWTVSVAHLRDKLFA
jgi:hypothetical protein